jgi:assimilatory nitrate reductase catalytic subunit
VRLFLRAADRHHVFHVMATSPSAPAETRSTCPYCGVGCGVIISHEGGVIRDVRGDPEHPANFGRLCTKGSTLHLSAGLEHRALKPTLRLSRDVARQEVSWDRALDACADRFADVIRRYGPDAVGFYISGQLLTEDYYVFNKLAKGLIGTNNVDTNSRLCMSSAVAGYKQTLGADAPPACYEDIDRADLILIAGSNTAYAHPILYRRIEDAKAANPALRIIVVDPRRTDTAREADLHLQLLPGTDIALFNAMLNVLLWEGLTDTAFTARATEGFDQVRASVRDMTPAAAARICGIAEQDIVAAARMFGSARAVLSLYCQGLNQSSHGTHNNVALINLHLATGQIGRPGAGPFSLTGQPNAMGGREVGGLANLLSAHRDLANPAHRAEVAHLWGVPEVPAKPGLAAVAMFEAVRRGEIKALWIACTNPAQSMPDQGAVREALAAAEFVVLQEAFDNTDTAAFADVLLPAATWGEKSGTVTNSERRITRVMAAVAPAGEARADWEIAADFARRLGDRLGRGDAARRLFDYASPEAVWNEHRESTRGRDLDITGLSYGILEQRGPQQWPMPEGATEGLPRLYADGVFPTPSTRARFVVTPHKPVAEPVNAAYPVALNTGRLRDQWHGMSRTGRVARLFNHAEEPRLSMSAPDMVRRGLADGDVAWVTSRRGGFHVRVWASDEVRIGHAFMPMHWGSQFMRGAGVNAVTVSVVDPYSQQPELKAAAIEVVRAKLPHHVVAMRRLPAHAASLLQERLKPMLAAFDYASLTLFGRDETVVILRGYAAAPIAEGILAALESMLGLDVPDRVMRYIDAARGVEKSARIDDGLMTGVCLSGETAAADWLKNLMQGDASLDAVRPWILAPVASPPKGSMSRGQIICNCFDVALSEISGDARAGLTLADIQTTRKCGTSCGSCLPEVKRIIGNSRTATAAAIGGGPMPVTALHPTGVA